MIRQRVKVGNALRGSRLRVAAAPAAPQPPVLTANNTNMSLDWTYSGPPCDQFELFRHLPSDPAGQFESWSVVPGAVRAYATDFDDPADAAGYKYYIVPEDGDNNALTAVSNTVAFG